MSNTIHRYVLQFVLSVASVVLLSGTSVILYGSYVVAIFHLIGRADFTYGQYFFLVLAPSFFVSSILLWSSVAAALLITENRRYCTLASFCCASMSLLWTLFVISNEIDDSSASWIGFYASFFLCNVATFVPGVIHSRGVGKKKGVIQR